MSDPRWKKLLTPESYAVLFEEATERPGSSELNGEKRKGIVRVRGLQLAAVRSDAKYERQPAGRGFFEPIAANIATNRDWKLVLPRTEYHCARCGGHQGHVFNDGPQPTGQRYCNNGVSLRFVPEGEPLPAERKSE
jgi:peptide-methionine (R)-S-oxide reductase